MRKLLALFGLLVGMGVVAGQNPQPFSDGLTFVPDGNGKMYPYLVKGLIGPPPWLLKGEGTVNTSKYPDAVITSKELTVEVWGQKMGGGGALLVKTKATVGKDGKTFTLVNPDGGVIQPFARVVVKGKYKPAPDLPERDAVLEGFAGVQEP